LRSLTQIAGLVIAVSRLHCSNIGELQVTTHSIIPMDGNQDAIRLSIKLGRKPGCDSFVYQSGRWMDSAQLACRIGRRLARFPWAAFRTNGLLQPEIVYRFRAPTSLRRMSSSPDAHSLTRTQSNSFVVKGALTRAVQFAGRSYVP
jgi:hypothetical protein